MSARPTADVVGALCAVAVLLMVPIGAIDALVRHGGGDLARSFA